MGYAYADVLMREGHWVVICDIKDPDVAVQALRQKHEGGIGKVFGTVCDVSSSESVEALGQFAKENLGTIHYWINNAGINGGRRPFSTLSTGTVEAVVRVNLIGILLCTRVALEVMQQQKGVVSHVRATRGRTRATRSRVLRACLDLLAVPCMRVRLHRPGCGVTASALTIR